MVDEFYERRADLVEYRGMLPTIGAIGANSSKEVSVALVGVMAGDAVFGSPGMALGNGDVTWCFWSAANDQISIRICNPTAAPVTPNDVNWSIYARLPRSLFDSIR